MSNKTWNGSVGQGTVQFPGGRHEHRYPDSTLNTTFIGATTTLGFGTHGREHHVEWCETATWNTTRFNIFDVAKNIYIKIMEW